MKIGRLLTVVVVVVFFFPAEGRPCTTFCFQHDGQWIFGRNYDWMVEHGMIVVNKRNVAKAAFVDNSPLRWISRYGSVTFNQYGRELPLGGMNEAGLVIECMWLSQTEYPHVDSRDEITELQWIQYQLDVAATVEEVIASDSTVRIRVEQSQPLHFLVCDRNGGCAAIEFLGGRMVVHSGNDLPATSLTNSTYEYSKGILEAFDGDEASRMFNVADYSLKRFIWAARGAGAWNPKTSGPPVEYAFGILEKVSVESTVWRIVYDVANGRVYFRTRSNGNIRFFEFGEFDFSCGSPVEILDMSLEGEGDVTGNFIDYTFEANIDLIHRTFAETDFLKNIPEEAMQSLARYPDSLPCKK